VLWMKSMPAFWTITGILAVFAVALPLVTKRRWWCYICPAGAILSFAQKISLFRVNIDRSKCIECMDCVRACRYYALTPQSVENGKCLGEYCVRCGRCIESCSEQAIDLSWIGSHKKAREPFIALVVATTFALYIWYVLLFVSFFFRIESFRWFS
jgi:polyferredoxin